ncbi:hypothetical protein V2J09_015943 [Rumex salicifolius]
MVMARALEVADEEPEIKLLFSGSPFSSPPQPQPQQPQALFMASSADHKSHHQLDFQQMHHNHPLQQSNQISFGGVMMPSSSSSSSVNPTSAVGTYIGRDGGGGGGYDLGELDQALFLYLDGQPTSDHHHHHNNNNNNPNPNLNPSSAEDQRQNSGMRPPTLNIFPSQPMHVDPSTKPSNGEGGGMSQSTTNCTNGPKRPQDPSMELSTDPKNNSNASAPSSDPSKSIKRQGNRRGLTSNSDGEGPKTPDPKTLRRLAQNREAARKSRLRKKAYVQQLESSRIRLTQIEQELQRARAQGIFFGGGGGGAGEQGIPAGVTNISSEAAVFDLEYTRWLEEHHKLTCELRAAVQEHLSDSDLKMYVDNYLAHYDVAITLKAAIARNDAFHLVSGMWMTPAERCFMWIGGFRPSEVIKIVMHQIEQLTEQQLLGICQLQQSTHEAEEGLSQGLDSLNQSISDTIASDALSWPPSMPNYMGQMAAAMNKLSALEGFLRQADGLRYQTFHRLHQLLTTRQAARCFLGIAEYFHRLRALSSLWVARPRQD